MWIPVRREPTPFAWRWRLSWRMVRQRTSTIVVVCGPAEKRDFKRAIRLGAREAVVSAASGAKWTVSAVAPWGEDGVEDLVEDGVLERPAVYLALRFLVESREMLATCVRGRLRVLVSCGQSWLDFACVGR